MDYLQEFERYLRVIKHSSDNTVSSYLRDISQFSDFCALHNTEDLAQVSQNICTEYIHGISADKSAASTLRVVSSLKCFYNYLQSTDRCLFNPTAGLKHVFSQKKELPFILSLEEMLRIINQPDTTEFKGIRDKAILELMYATGIKATELIELTVDRLNLDIGILHIPSKNGERNVPIYKKAIKNLSLYLNSVRPIIAPNSNVPYLFTNMNGDKLTRQGLWKIIKTYSVAAGITAPITPHTIRHTFAVHLIENGAKPNDVKTLLGNSDISSMQIYTDYIRSKKTNPYLKFHPLG